MAHPVKTKTLKVAAQSLGGPRKLRDFFRAPSEKVVAWLAGIEDPPKPMFLRALEVILDDLDASDGAQRTDPGAP